MKDKDINKLLKVLKSEYFLSTHYKSRVLKALSNSVINRFSLDSTIPQKV